MLDYRLLPPPARATGCMSTQTLGCDSEQTGLPGAPIPPIRPHLACIVLVALGPLPTFPGTHSSRFDVQQSDWHVPAPPLLPLQRRACCK